MAWISLLNFSYIKWSFYILSIPMLSLLKHLSAMRKNATYTECLRSLKKYPTHMYYMVRWQSDGNLIHIVTSYWSVYYAGDRTQVNDQSWCITRYECKIPASLFNSTKNLFSFIDRYIMSWESQFATMYPYINETGST